ncbi:peptide ABC transporter ATP-binding protein, partial [Streptomyces sp. PT12]
MATAVFETRTAAAARTEGVVKAYGTGETRVLALD